MRTKTVFLALLLLAGCATNAPVKQELANSVLLDGDDDSCSGTAVSDRLVLTAYHCHVITNIVAYQEYPTITKHAFIRVVKSDEASDLMLLEFSPGFVPVELAGDDDRPQIGDPIQLVGCPMGHCNTVTEGYISALLDKKHDKFVFSAAAFPGGSGGGVFWHGKLISVLQAIGYEQLNPISQNYAPSISYGSTLEAFRAFVKGM